MDKKLVLEIVEATFYPLAPDDLRRQLPGKYARTSVYAYLLRLQRQKLVERTFRGKRIAYRITYRGKQRLEYFKGRST